MLGIIVSLLAVLAALGFAFNSDCGPRRSHSEWIELIRDSSKQASSNHLLPSRRRT